ncbi:Hypothetical predicted protein [Octopus vulgaris]|uniref:Uncharacterized protein n=1 Tax=Octopus vulgaris TaxID=6645 RepID=A0AA36AJ45_OCTVU|nr:Hypothetical predicted protein [Octopus vulgaris]
MKRSSRLTYSTSLVKEQSLKLNKTKRKPHVYSSKETKSKTNPLHFISSCSVVFDIQYFQRHEGKQKLDCKLFMSLVHKHLWSKRILLNRESKPTNRHGASWVNVFVLDRFFSIDYMLIDRFSTGLEDIKRRHKRDLSTVSDDIYCSKTRIRLQEFEKPQNQHKAEREFCENSLIFNQIYINSLTKSLTVLYIVHINSKRRYCDI